jgi:hypothetical protein
MSLPFVQNTWEVQDAHKVPQFPWHYLHHNTTSSILVVQVN